MEQQRRREEQEKEAQLFAPVDARDKTQQIRQSGPEQSQGKSIKQHPYLQGQKFAGMPDKHRYSGPDAEIEMENEQLKNELEYKLRNNLIPSTAPTFKPPG